MMFPAFQTDVPFPTCQVFQTFLRSFGSPLQRSGQSLLLLLALHKSGFDRTATAIGLPHPLYDEAHFTIGFAELARGTSGVSLFQRWPATIVKSAFAGQSQVGCSAFGLSYMQTAFLFYFNRRTVSFFATLLRCFWFIYCICLHLLLLLRFALFPSAFLVLLLCEHVSFWRFIALLLSFSTLAS